MCMSTSESVRRWGLFVGGCVRVKLVVWYIFFPDGVIEMRS